MITDEAEKNNNGWLIFLSASTIILLVVSSNFFLKKKTSSLITPVDLAESTTTRSAINKSPGVDPRGIVGLLKLVDLDVILAKNNLSDNTRKFVSRNGKVEFDYPQFVNVYEEPVSDSDIVRIMVTSDPDDYKYITDSQRCKATYGEEGMCDVPQGEYLSFYFYEDFNGEQPDPSQLGPKIAVEGNENSSKDVYLSGESAVKYYTLGNVLPDGKVEFYGNASTKVTREVLPYLSTTYAFFNNEVRVGISTQGSVYTWPYKQAFAQIVNSYLGYPERLTAFYFVSESEWKDNR